MTLPYLGSWREPGPPDVSLLRAARACVRAAPATGAVLSAIFGLVAWLAADTLAADATLPSPLVGLIFSVFGMVMGSLLPREHAAPAHGTHGSHPQHKP